MNHQLRFKKLALSALLVSAVAVPTVTNAASEPKSDKATITTQAVKVSTSITAVACSWANPLELAKAYAPSTLEDWTKTLEQYKKVVGNRNNTQSINMDMAGIKPGQAFEKATLVPEAVEITSGTPAVSGEGSYKQFSVLMDKAILGPDQVFEVDFSEGMGVVGVMASTVAVEISTADQAFFKAQFALDEAAKSKDATVIKEALAKLLEQYKLQIAQSNEVEVDK